MIRALGNETFTATATRKKTNPYYLDRFESYSIGFHSPSYLTETQTLRFDILNGVALRHKHETSSTRIGRLSSRRHVINGFGCPLAAHNSRTLAPSFTSNTCFLSFIPSIDGATGHDMAIANQWTMEIKKNKEKVTKTNLSIWDIL
ncbi:hypothetical protein BLOT_012560 [Blomia tropicalis]|nr:hypothetical protein BLOT_012560 [Blomia tropicalis]